MGALLSSTQRADNPSIPLTFPSRQSQSQQKENGEKVGNILRHVERIFSGVFDTLLDFGDGLDDDRTPIHSGTEGLEFQPKVTTKMTFSLDQLKQIKDNLNVATSRCIKGTLEKSSITITNMIGPIEKISMANHPVSGFYYIVSGCPRSLVVTMVSYMGKLNVVFATEKGLIDTEKYKSCIENAFQMTLKATGHAVS
ncbi:hypothetical protein TEA_003865 [Camellia sinensis var. sinensis]|uniref:O-acyltransferase WSD1 C-terminal domain-containing protein n=1 Tax=Camellia sinensis var. sinensis TaxID=542762 RepID=A0A4S4EV07_CAMSN|nr:hypothetical protein TEA_003865 [Camellia sinensis var. sinensis]